MKNILNNLTEDVKAANTDAIAYMTRAIEAIEQNDTNGAFREYQWICEAVGCDCEIIDEIGAMELIKNTDDLTTVRHMVADLDGYDAEYFIVNAYGHFSNVTLDEVASMVLEQIDNLEA